MSARCEVVRTRVGALAMLDKSSGEVMHPLGPLLEAERLYVTASRLRHRLSVPPPSGVTDALVLFDVGLGAGTNAAAAFRLSEQLPDPHRGLRIESFERSFDALELALQPDNRAHFGFDPEAALAAQALLLRDAHRTERTVWRLRRGDLLTSLRQCPATSADVVFWDPFSARTDPAPWTVAAFTALRRACRPGATVHTYSGATSVRSALLLAGFAVGIGEPISRGKFGTCAATSLQDLARPLDRRWLERLKRSSAPFAVDAPADAMERIAAMAQFAGGVEATRE